MDRIRTLLLARTSTVVLDPDRVASAATRPSRDIELDRFEDELAQLGFVMSLDLAMTVRRLPYQTVQELKSWIIDTLAKTTGAHRPHVPLFRGFPATTPQDTSNLYLRRVLTWLLTRPQQPCPWCGQVKTVGALDPCGHLVCRSCWDGGTYAGCPICHRRIAMGDPFVIPPAVAGAEHERVGRHDGELRLVHLAFDVVGTARQRFERLIARTTPLSKDDRDEIETVIDTIGPKAAIWMPSKIPVKETMAIAVARMWVVALDRSAMVKATQGHLRTATDVLRVAAVLMSADPGLVEPMKVKSVSRGLRRAVLEALDRIEPALLLEDVMRHPGLWKRVGERLHPFERAVELPNAALAFAAIRGTDLAAVTFADELRAAATTIESVRISDDRVKVTPWAGPVEDSLRAGDARAAAERLGQRPGELLRRVDHLVRVTCAKQADALGDVLAAIQRAIVKGAPKTLLTLVTHIAARTHAWPRRVFFPKGNVLRAWGMPDLRPPLRADAIGAIVNAIRSELLARAEGKRQFARAVIDRALVDLLVPLGERSASKSKIALPRGSEIPMPAGATVRLFLHWEEPPQTRVDLDLSVALYDASWRHVGTCDFNNLVVGQASAVHSGDLTSAPPPLGASEFVDLQLDALAAMTARYAVMVVFSYNAVSFDRLTYGFAGLMIQPEGPEPFDPRSVAQRFDLFGRSVITVPLSIDLESRRMRWLDVHVKDQGAMHQVGGYRVALAHIGRDFEDLVGTGARATLWDVACIHAAARANVIYVRERDGQISTIRHRDGETVLARLARLHANEHDGQRPTIPPANAPTWVALLRDDVAIPTGSAGYILDARATSSEVLHRVEAADLIADLVAK